LVPFIRKWALDIQFVDKPSHRKIHAMPIPLMGGIAIYIGTMGAMLLFLGLTSQVITLGLGGGLLLLIGLTDDWYKSKGIDFPIWPRLSIQIIAAGIPVWFGIRIIGITHAYQPGMYIFPEWFAIVATMLWIVAITNMINFIDGVDGLATGIVTISSLTLFLVAYWQIQESSAIMAIVLVGASLAFLKHNFFPAKIFMGDAGATFLGYALAVISVDGAFKSATLVSIIVPFLALGVPILDTVYVVFRRIREKTGIHKGDRMHTHHSLMKWGLNQIQTVSFLYLIGMLFSLISIIVLLTLS
jgi:UDP-GlcNAc:undecaprenyl-phosphate GlcNAc-1-phosphate transferase